MNTTEATLLAIQVLSGTFAAVFLFASLVLFQSDEDKRPFPIEALGCLAALSPLIGGIWLVCELFTGIFRHWNESPTGRRCFYGFVIALAAFGGSFLWS